MYQRSWFLWSRTCQLDITCWRVFTRSFSGFMLPCIYTLTVSTILSTWSVKRHLTGPARSTWQLSCSGVYLFQSRVTLSRINDAAIGGWMGMSESDEDIPVFTVLPVDRLRWHVPLRPIYNGWIEQSPDELARASLLYLPALPPVSGHSIVSGMMICTLL
jgi:hypothetical protein